MCVHLWLVAFGRVRVQGLAIIIIPSPNNCHNMRLISELRFLEFDGNVYHVAYEARKIVKHFHSYSHGLQSWGDASLGNLEFEKFWSKMQKCGSGHSQFDVCESITLHQVASFVDWSVFVDLEPQFSMWSGMYHRLQDGCLASLRWLCPQRRVLCQVLQSLIFEHLKIANECCHITIFFKPHVVVVFLQMIQGLHNSSVVD